MPAFLRATAAFTNRPIMINVNTIAKVDGYKSAVVHLLDGEKIPVVETSSQIVGQLASLQRQQVKS